MRKGCILICFILMAVNLLAQERIIEYNASMSGSVSTKDHLPFWATTNKFGLLPDGNGGFASLGFFSDFTDKHKIQFAYGVSAAGYLSKPDDNILIDELYLSARWKKLRLDLGMIHRDTEFNGVSVSNGNSVYSNNARTMPGYNLRSEYINIPYTFNLLSFQFNQSDYLMVDDSYVDDTRIHNKSLFLKLSPNAQWEFIWGLEHFAQWAGTSPDFGKQPSSFKDYVKIFFGREGGSGSTASDSMNALGNHLGREHYQINYLDDHFTLSIYVDRPFEDGSGLRRRNMPDGIYGIYYGAKDKNQWISDIIYEFIHTKDQSGRAHDRPRTDKEKEGMDPNDPNYNIVVLGGNDDYFNNGEYKSGWTYYGRTIGTALLTPKQPNEKGITLGVYNNRVCGHHLGIKGVAFHRVPYKFMGTYTLNYGTNAKPLASSPQKQLSLALETAIPEIKNLPFNMEIGMYTDFGKLLGDNFGFTLKLTRKGYIK